MAKKKTASEVLADSGMADALKTRQGRALLWSMLEDAGCFRISFDPLAPSRTFFNEGGRNQGNRLLARIQASSIDGFLLMQREAFARATGDDREREQRRATEFGSGVGSDDDGQGSDEGQ